MIQEDNTRNNENYEQYKERLTNFSQDFELGLFIHLAQKSILWVILFFVIAFSASTLYLRYTHPLYTSASVIQLKESNQANLILDIERMSKKGEISADIEIIRSKEFLKSIFVKLPLTISYYSEGEFLVFEHYKTSPYEVKFEIKSPEAFRKKYVVKFVSEKEVLLLIEDGNKITEHKLKVGNWETLAFVDLKFVIIDYDIINDQKEDLVNNDYFFTLNSNQEILTKYSSKLKVKLLNKEANSVEVSFTSNNPRKATDLSNAISTGFIDYDLDRQISSSNQIIDFVENQLNDVFVRLKNSEVSIQEFKIDNKVSNSEGFTEMYIDRLSILEEESIKLELEQDILLELKVASDGEGDSVDVYDLLPLLAGTQFEIGIKEQIQRLHELLLEKEQSMYEVTSENGRVKNLQYQIAIQKKLLVESINSFSNKIEARKNNVSEKIKEIEDRFTGMPLQELKFNRLKRVFSINEKFYTLLLEKKAEYSISRAGITPESVILERASPPKMPISPKLALQKK